MTKSGSRQSVKDKQVATLGDLTLGLLVALGMITCLLGAGMVAYKGFMGHPDWDQGFVVILGGFAWLTLLVSFVMALQSGVTRPAEVTPSDRFSSREKEEARQILEKANVKFPDDALEPSARGKHYDQHH